MPTDAVELVDMGLFTHFRIVSVFDVFSPGVKSSGEVLAGASTIGPGGVPVWGHYYTWYDDLRNGSTIPSVIMQQPGAKKHSIFKNFSVRARPHFWSQGSTLGANTTINPNNTYPMKRVNSPWLTFSNNNVQLEHMLYNIAEEANVNTTFYQTWNVDRYYTVQFRGLNFG